MVFVWLSFYWMIFSSLVVLKLISTLLIADNLAELYLSMVTSWLIVWAWSVSMPTAVTPDCMLLSCGMFVFVRGRASLGTGSAPLLTGSMCFVFIPQGLYAFATDGLERAVTQFQTALQVCMVCTSGCTHVLFAHLGEEGGDPQGTGRRVCLCCAFLQWADCQQCLSLSVFLYC